MSEEITGEGNVDLNGLGSFDFMPAWAKGPASDPGAFRAFEERPPRQDDRPARGSFSRDRRGEGRDFPAPRGNRPQRERPPRQERDGQDRPGRGQGDRGPSPRGDFRGRPQQRFERREFVEPMDADIRILPSQKELGPIIRKIQTTHQAYPLKQLAYLFLDNPQSCIVRITPRKAEGADGIEFHQCKACGYAVLTEEELQRHILEAHLGDYYELQEVDAEPPKGAFTCVAKCGLSGELLGPPNLHGFDARVREMIRTRYPGMSEQEYRSHIEMVKDSEAIEAWRSSAVKKTIFRKKDTPDAPALERQEAEQEMRRTILPGLLSRSKTVDMTAEAALKSPIKSLLYACREALAKERRFPASLFFALRGAFHHRKLTFFRANDSRGPEFVCASRPVPFDAAHAVPELAALVKYASDHPCTLAGEMIAALAEGDQAKKAEFATHLKWLVEKGNLIQYFNGAVTAPAQNPRYMPPPKAKKPVQQPAAVAPAAPAAPAQPEPPAEPEAPATPAEPSAPAAPEAPAEPAAESAAVPEAPAAEDSSITE